MEFYATYEVQALVTRGFTVSDEHWKQYLADNPDFDPAFDKCREAAYDYFINFMDYYEETYDSEDTDSFISKVEMFEGAN